MIEIIIWGVTIYLIAVAVLALAALAPFVGALALLVLMAITWPFVVAGEWIARGWHAVTFGVFKKPAPRWIARCASKSAQIALVGGLWLLLAVLWLD